MKPSAGTIIVVRLGTYVRILVPRALMSDTGNAMATRLCRGALGTAGKVAALSPR